ncbi:MAG: ACP S-malonyltransferase [Planctomycetota bacterium]|jgi:malonyl CoA-acyl carrier protein transacylase
MSGPLRVALICPGRGSYGRDELGSLTRAGVSSGDPAAADAAREAALSAIDQQRAARGEGPLIELDQAERFSPSRHLRADHASELILAGAAIDLSLVREAERRGALEVVCVCGNSLGFYLALFASGALSLPETARLIGTMGALQVERGTVGGQLIYPVADPDTWAPDPKRLGAVASALARGLVGAADFAGDSVAGQRFVSIRLGGTRVLAGDKPGLEGLLAELPAIERSGRRFPLRLAGHSAFHTPLMAPMAVAARDRLSDLDLRRPVVPLIDGRGAVWSPLATDPDDLFRYTLDHQVTEPYDFTASVRVALREFAPDALVLTGPGNSLGAPVGQILVAERYRGIDGKAAFQEVQAGETPPVHALGRPADRARFLEHYASGS